MKFKNKRKIIFIMGIFILMASIILSVFVLMPPETNNKKTETQNPAIQNPTIQNVEPSKTPSTYGNLMKSFNENVPEFYYHYKDIDGNGVYELLILENCALYIYTYDDNGVRQIGSHDFVTGTVRMFSSQNPKYPGIFYFTVGGGCDHYGYLTLNGDNIVTTPLCEYYYSADEPYWVDINDDKEMIAEAKALYKENKDIIFLDFEPITNAKNSATFLNGTKWYTATVLFDEDNLSAKSLVIIDLDTNKKIQKIALNRSEEVTTTDKNIYALDVNFDGYLDLLIPDMHPARAIFFSAYIYDSAQQKFVEAPSFKNIPNFALDTQNKQILYYSGGDSMFNYGIACYDKDKKDFVTTNSILIKPNYTGGTTEFAEYHFKERRYQDGKEIIVNEFNIPLHEFHLYPVSNSDMLPYYENGSFWDLSSDKWDCIFKFENGKVYLPEISDTLSVNLSLDEVKKVFEPLIQKGESVHESINNDLADIEMKDKIAFTLENGGYEYNYQLITDENFKTLDDVWQFAYSAYTHEAAYRLFTDRLEQSGSPRFLERDGKLYYYKGGHGYNTDFDFDSLQIVTQFDNTVIISIDDYGFGTDENSPDKCTFILQYTQNGWRLANSVVESYNIDINDYIAAKEYFEKVLNNEQSFYSTSKKADVVLSDYNKKAYKYSYVDMDNDNINELAIELEDGNVLILRIDGESVIGFEFNMRAMYQINIDGSFYWNKNSGNTYGCSKLEFTDKTYKTIELWRVENNESGSTTYYINGKTATKEELDSLSKPPSIKWYSLSTTSQKPTKFRNIGEWQSETQEIITINGQEYQSYVTSNVDIRYVFVSNEEYEMSAEWGWVPIGTRNFYSLDLLGKVNEGRQ